MTAYDDLRARTERETELHRIALRSKGFRLAAAVLAVLFIFEAVLPCLLWDIARHQDSPPSLIALSIAQVASITTITLMILFAVFRGSRDRGLNALPVNTLTRLVREECAG
ncbi:MAG: hypothetical protein OXC91_06625 [Rhodobacteraceae bacterium]|nr:hypothetical protein [Paracoccaceae bacterium]